ncbi:MAG: hypothetical protein VYE68_15480 [Acidobacteriota bacterium]|nr:hypothetical protein [Acidobacteriota bacterium]
MGEYRVSGLRQADGATLARPELRLCIASSPVVVDVLTEVYLQQVLAATN